MTKKEILLAINTGLSFAELEARERESQRALYQELLLKKLETRAKKVEAFTKKLNELIEDSVTLDASHMIIDYALSLLDFTSLSNVIENNN